MSFQRAVFKYVVVNKVGELIVGPAKAKGPAVNLNDLMKVKTLGTGTFGRVKLVQHKHTKQVQCSAVQYRIDSL